MKTVIAINVSESAEAKLKYPSAYEAIIADSKAKIQKLEDKVKETQVLLRKSRAFYKDDKKAQANEELRAAWAEHDKAAKECQTYVEKTYAPKKRPSQKEIGFWDADAVVKANPKDAKLKALFRAWNAAGKKVQKAHGKLGFKLAPFTDADLR